MNKSQFLTELKEILCGLPDNDIQSSLDYYSEIIDDHIEDGFTEEDSVSQVGNPQEIAKQILADTPILKLVKQRIKPKHKISTLEIMFLILGSPIWLSLLIAAIAVVVSVYVSLWAAVVSLWACEAAFCGSALGGAIASVCLFASEGDIFAASIMVAAALVLIGISILFFFVCRASTKGMVLLTKKLTLRIKSCFLRKERAQ
ncbi:MAG: DUF1700 domain-containing protein [Clostridia bacterium]|nr:DUF1700 domain-containing protein [Clostridia bacterium]